MSGSILVLLFAPAPFARDSSHGPGNSRLMPKFVRNNLHRSVPIAKSDVINVRVMARRLNETNREKNVRVNKRAFAGQARGRGTSFVRYREEKNFLRDARRFADDPITQGERVIRDGTNYCYRYHRRV